DEQDVPQPVCHIWVYTLCSTAARKALVLRCRTGLKWLATKIWAWSDMFLMNRLLRASPELLLLVMSVTQLSAQAPSLMRSLSQHAVSRAWLPWLITGI